MFVAIQQFILRSEFMRNCVCLCRFRLRERGDLQFSSHHGSGHDCNIYMYWNSLIFGSVVFPDVCSNVRGYLFTPLFVEFFYSTSAPVPIRHDTQRGHRWGNVMFQFFLFAIQLLVCRFGVGHCFCYVKPGCVYNGSHNILQQHFELVQGPGQQGQHVCVMNVFDLWFFQRFVLEVHKHCANMLFSACLLLFALFVEFVCSGWGGYVAGVRGTNA